MCVCVYVCVYVCVCVCVCSNPEFFLLDPSLKFLALVSIRESKGPGYSV